LEQLSERFLRAIDYYGLVEMEYKLDLRDGQYKLFDVNGRTWGYHSIGHSAGVDFPSMLFADQSAGVAELALFPYLLIKRGF
jgi:D-aspartate ligase